jgi:hypothetical protein
MSGLQVRGVIEGYKIADESNRTCTIVLTLPKPTAPRPLGTIVKQLATTLADLTHQRAVHEFCHQGGDRFSVEDTCEVIGEGIRSWCRKDHKFDPAKMQAPESTPKAGDHELRDRPPGSNIELI